MAARSVPRVAACPPWRAALGFGFEWPRVLFGRGDAPASTRWQLRLALVWPVLIGLIFVTESQSVPTDRYMEPAVERAAIADAGAEDGSGGDAKIDLDLSVLSRGRMFPAPVERARPQRSAIVPDLGTELELRGVIGGDDPQAIIFHQRTQQTHSVRVGQTFGEFEVIEIRAMRVILGWRDETIELSI